MEVVLEAVSPLLDDSGTHKQERLSDGRSASHTEKCAHKLRITLNADSASGPCTESQDLYECKNAPTP